MLSSTKRLSHPRDLTLDTSKLSQRFSQRKLTPQLQRQIRALNSTRNYSSRDTARFTSRKAPASARQLSTLLALLLTRRYAWAFSRALAWVAAGHRHGEWSVLLGQLLGEPSSRLASIEYSFHPVLLDETASQAASNVDSPEPQLCSPAGVQAQHEASTFLNKTAVSILRSRLEQLSSTQRPLKVALS